VILAFLRKRLHHRPSPLGQLTPRQFEVLRHVAMGQTNEQIAYELGCSAQTVKNHLTQIFLRLDCPDRTSAVMYAVRAGWIK
jgi:two-component system, NarL family, response regulator DegU